MEDYFRETVWPELSKLYSSYGFANYEGTRKTEQRTGEENGGWRVNLYANGERAFIFARGSRTEAGVWRLSQLRARLRSDRRVGDSAVRKHRVWTSRS